MCTMIGDFSADRKSENFLFQVKIEYLSLTRIAQSMVLQCAIFLLFWIKSKHSFIYKYFGSLKGKSGVDEIIFKKQVYQLLNTSRDFFPSFDAYNFHKLVSESS